MLSFFSRGDECEKHYKLGRTLGKGSFATVRLATLRSDNTKYAVKIITKKELSKEDSDALETEVAIMKDLGHENMVHLTQVFDCPSKFYMVMDLCTGGEMFDRIIQKTFYTEDEARKSILQINSALHYCHKKNIVHRDLKPENLLYARPEPDETIKLADFGLAYILKPDTLMTTACGTPGYVAPEVLTNKGYGPEVDMWSLGVILYILLVGYPPFYDESSAVLFELIKHGDYEFCDPYWEDISDEAKALVSKLLTVDPSKRATTTDVMNDPWMASTAGKDKHLKYFNENLRNYNAKRKFRQAILGMQVVNALKAAGKKKVGPLLQATQNARDAAAAAEEKGAADGPTLEEPAPSEGNAGGTTEQQSAAAEEGASPPQDQVLELE